MQSMCFLIQSSLNSIEMTSIIYHNVVERMLNQLEIILIYFLKLNSQMASNLKLNSQMVNSYQNF